MHRAMLRRALLAALLAAICTPAHVCVVGPDTRRNPAMAPRP